MVQCRILKGMWVLIGYLFCFVVQKRQSGNFTPEVENMCHFHLLEIILGYEYILA